MDSSRASASERRISHRLADVTVGIVVATSFVVLAAVMFIPSRASREAPFKLTARFSPVLPATHTRAAAARRHAAPQSQPPLPNTASGGVTIPTNERITSTQTLATAGIILWPAPPSFNPGVSQAEAATELASAGFADRPTSLLFGLMSDTTGMETIEANGSTKPLYVGAPVWVAETHGVMYPVGGLDVTDPSASRPVQPATGACFTFANAMTGKYEFASCTASYQSNALTGGLPGAPTARH